MKNKLILLLLVLSFQAFSAESFSIKIKPDGFFDIDYQMTFSANENLNDIFNDLFLDESNQKIVNEDLISQKSSINLKNAIFKNGTYNYVLTTEAKRTGVTATIKNTCVLNVKNETIFQSCVISSSSAGIFGKMFKSGSSSMTCQKNNEIKCNIIIKGQALAINAFFVSRTADRLAISGSSKTVTDLHKSYMLRTENSSKAINAFSGNFSQLWDKMMKKLDKNEKLNSSFSAISSNSGLLVIK